MEQTRSTISANRQRNGGDLIALYTVFHKKHVYKKNEAEISQKLRNMGRLSLESKLEKTVVVRNILLGRNPSCNSWLSGVFDVGSRVETGGTW